VTAARVWAPRAECTVDVLLGKRRIPLERRENGWWEGAPDALEHGTEYAFSLDGLPPRPDPRSPWQPEGPHGPSRWVDHARHEWQDDGWQPPAWQSAVVYELHIGAFTPEGTLDSAIEHLDDLVELGVSHLELMPVAEFPGAHGWGYDGVDLYAVESSYGGPEALKRFVGAAHARGLAVLLDVVYNHFGPDGNYLMEFGPYLTDRYHTPWGDAVNLDGAGSDEVRRFFIDNAIQWLRDYHLDGLRLDAVHALIDTSAKHFLEQLSEEVDELEAELGRPLVLVAESDLGDPRIVRPREEHGYGMDAQWNDESRHALHVTLTREQDGIHGDFSGLRDLCTAISEVFVYQGQRSAFRERGHGRPVGGLPRSKFVSFMQNHDQTGNRAKGERSSHLLEPDALKVAAALVLLGPNVPMLFFGEEWAASTPFLYFADHQDPELAEAVRQGRRREFAAFGWPEEDVPDPGAVETFQRSKLDWAERDKPPHSELLEWHRRLIRVRRELPHLAAGPAPDVRCDVDVGWLTIERSGTLVAVNVGEAEVTLDLPGGSRRWRLELASRDEVAHADTSNEGGLVLAPMTAALLLEVDAA
jgi:maltooligosyltrehalose trehalohydrolase